MKLKLDIKKIKAVFGKIFLFAAENVFLFCLALFLLALVIGGVILYKAMFLSGQEDFGNIGSLKLEKDSYDNILKTWDEESKKYDEADIKNYPNPFYFKPSSPATNEVD